MSSHIPGYKLPLKSYVYEPQGTRRIAETVSLFPELDLLERHFSTYLHDNKRSFHQL